MSLNSYEPLPATMVYPMPVAMDRPSSRVVLPLLPDVPGPIPTTTSTTQPESETGMRECLRAMLLERRGENLPAIEDTVDLLTKPMVQPKVLIEGVLHQGSIQAPALAVDRPSFGRGLAAALAHDVAPLELDPTFIDRAESLARDKYAKPSWLDAR